ncbi:TOL protein [Colletotrichum higginsianum IMI 349063]|uniref:TOL protein n=1 Tax=Colletotrichum higginsianum (strain IMI 349063) TaxID=759273 RepID=A0A1B7YEM1_COLHI|nr:TOL protein [Colletotrichum higginsianum IMI 349063]OBR10482.1 TOL protein [Colletotrichum higginsianum IMI 349063]
MYVSSRQNSFLKPMLTRENVIDPQTLNDAWEFVEDNGFAGQVFNRHLQLEGTHPGSSSVTPERASILCNRCQRLDFWVVGFAIRDTLSALEANWNICELCRLLHDSWRRFGTADSVEFRRVGSVLAIRGSEAPALSIYRTNLNDSGGLSNPPKDIQIGFPKLPDIGCPTHVEILRQWLQDCDKNHAMCCSDNNPGSYPARTPTRLIDVGPKGQETVRLLETRSSQQGEDPSKPAGFEYIALSHPWGDRALHQHFCTTRDNIHDHMNRISDDSLPATFKDAIRVTRDLNVRYLWIDSLCIVQGEDGDFEDEAQHMETVFSSALCVIAANSATGTSDGFLKQRPDRTVVVVARPSESPFYICEAIDDFQRDVVEGALSKRGWVLQERALARRTIYFTSRQVYWECGEGIRCETLTRMRNSQAAFLGDARFPNVATGSSKGGQIRLYESLYTRYSRLQFSDIRDRPIAIAGLEQRLIRAFNTKGGYGVFERYFGRGLLWRRDPDDLQTALERIDFAPTHRQQQQRLRSFRVPSWSWMAYKGSITFMDLPFDAVLWETNDIKSPWYYPPRNGSDKSWLSTSSDGGQAELVGVARDFVELVRDDGRIIYDGGERPRDVALKCVVVGRRKSEVVAESYVLVVAPKPHGEVDAAYERVGVGAIPGSWIVTGQPGLEVRIV